MEVQDVERILTRARRALQELDYSEIDCGSVGDFNEALRDIELRVRKSAFDAGIQLGSKLAQTDAINAIGMAALEILGKDRADGEIDLGALGKFLAE